MERLKADLHTHSGDDPCDPVAYSSEMLIDAVSARGIRVLAITCHDYVAYSASLAEYASRRGVLLIPGVERTIDRRHVVVLNPHEDHCAAQTLDELREVGRKGAVLVAPHPFYPVAPSLGRRLYKYIDLFDAIEYCTLYFPGVNPNRRAVAVAKRHGLPLVGTSDAHTLPYCDSTTSWITAEPTVESVLDAIRCGRVEVETRPRPARHAFRMVRCALSGTVRQLVGGRAAGQAGVAGRGDKQGQHGDTAPVSEEG